MVIVAYITGGFVELVNRLLKYKKPIHVIQM